MTEEFIRRQFALRAGPPPSNSDHCGVEDSLASKRQEVAAFLAAAAHAPPPVSIEENDEGKDEDNHDSESPSGGIAQKQIHMKVLCGVFEERDVVPRTDGIIIPTPEHHEQLNDAAHDEAVAMINLVDALLNNSDSDEDEDGDVVFSSTSDSEDGQQPHRPTLP